MKVILPSCQPLFQEPGFEGAMKHIERCGRVCYKSEDKITEESYKGFVERMKKSEHYAMCEHATIYLILPIKSPIGKEDADIVKLKNFFKDDKEYSRVVKKKYTEADLEKNVSDYIEYPIKDVIVAHKSCNAYYITTNYRVILENGLEEEIKPYICADSVKGKHILRVTAHFVTDRGVWNEFIRHRKMARVDDCDCEFDIVDYSAERHFSFAQESTRFCGYHREKFGNELVTIKPSWVNLNIIRDIEAYEAYKEQTNIVTRFIEKAFDKVFNDCAEKLTTEYWKKTKEYVWYKNMVNMEKDYFKLTKDFGCQPQEGRTVLTNSLKTELVMTGFVDEKQWLHFFDLRYRGTTGKPQPEAQNMAMQLYWQMLVYGAIPSSYVKKEDWEHNK